MKKLLLFALLFCVYKTKAQWHRLPWVPNCVTNYYGSVSCPYSLIVAGDGHILYSDYTYYSPSSGYQSDIYESYDDLNSSVAKVNWVDFMYGGLAIIASINTNSFLYYNYAHGGEIGFTNDDFSHTNNILVCSGTSSLFPNNSTLTSNYTYFYGQPNAIDSFVISKVPNTQSSPNFCNKIFKYSGQQSILKFVNDSVGYLFCSYRSNLTKKVLLKTINYGSTWVEIYIDSLTNITEVNFPSENVGYLLKSDGSLVKTSDGGSTWGSLNGPNSNFTHMAFSNDSIGYIGGNSGFLVRTVDGGNTWIPQISNTSYNIRSIYAFPSDVAYFRDSVGVIYKNKPLLNSIASYYSYYKLTVYPNPAQNNFTVEISNTEKQNLQVFDVNGKLVLTQTINGTTNIDASNLSQGVYNVSIASSEGVVNKRLVIVR